MEENKKLKKPRQRSRFILPFLIAALGVMAVLFFLRVDVPRQVLLLTCDSQANREFLAKEEGVLKELDRIGHNVIIDYGSPMTADLDALNTDAQELSDLVQVQKSYKAPLLLEDYAKGVTELVETYYQAVNYLSLNDLDSARQYINKFLDKRHAEEAALARYKKECSK